MTSALVVYLIGLAAIIVLWRWDARRAYRKADEANDYARGLRRLLADAHLELTQTRPLVSCKSPVEHLRLAARLQRAETDLAIALGREPHEASRG